jgi:hypothetical protein
MFFWDYYACLVLSVRTGTRRSYRTVLHYSRTSYLYDVSLEEPWRYYCTINVTTAECHSLSKAIPLSSCVPVPVRDLYQETFKRRPIRKQNLSGQVRGVYRYPVRFIIGSELTINYQSWCGPARGGKKRPNNSNKGMSVRRPSSVLFRPTHASIFIVAAIPWCIVVVPKVVPVHHQKGIRRCLRFHDIPVVVVPKVVQYCNFTERELKGA